MISKLCHVVQILVYFSLLILGDESSRSISLQKNLNKVQVCF